MDGSRYNLQRFNKFLDLCNSLRVLGANIYFLDLYNTNICYNIDEYDRVKSQSSEIRYYNKKQMTIRNFDGLSFVDIDHAV